MTGLWLVSYIALWGLMLVLSLLLVGLLRQVGILHHALAARSADSTAPIPTPENDGPPLGSRLPKINAEAVNGGGSVLPARQHRERTLIAFLSPLCESCQHTAELLNVLAADTARRVRPVVIMQADEQTSRAFMGVFPLRVPLTCDDERTLAVGTFNVHRAPYGLVYDEHGMLTSKGIVSTEEQLYALLGETSASAQAQVAPQPA